MSPTKTSHHFPVDSVSPAVQTGNHIPERAWLSQKPLTKRINPENTAFETILLLITARKFHLLVKISSSKYFACFLNI